MRRSVGVVAAVADHAGHDDHVQPGRGLADPERSVPDQELVQVRGGQAGQPFDRQAPGARERLDVGRLEAVAILLPAPRRPRDLLGIDVDRVAPADQHRRPGRPAAHAGHLRDERYLVPYIDVPLQLVVHLCARHRLLDRAHDGAGQPVQVTGVAEPRLLVRIRQVGQLDVSRPRCPDRAGVDRGR